MEVRLGLHVYICRFWVYPLKTSIGKVNCNGANILSLKTPVTATTVIQVDALSVPLQTSAINVNAHIMDFGHVKMLDSLNAVAVKLIEGNVKETRQ